jgi:hypothetical protein
MKYMYIWNMGDINCKFLDSWGLMGRTKTDKNLPFFQKSFSPEP